MDSGSNEKLVIVQEHELLGYRAVKPAAKRGRPVKGTVTLSGVTVNGDVAGRDIVTSKAAS